MVSCYWTRCICIAHRSYHVIVIVAKWFWDLIINTYFVRVPVYGVRLSNRLCGPSRQCRDRTVHGPHSAWTAKCMGAKSPFALWRDELLNAWTANYTGCAAAQRTRCKCAWLSAWAEVVSRGRVPHCLPTIYAPVTRLLGNATLVPLAMSRNYPARCWLRGLTGVTPLSANPPTQPAWTDIKTKPGLVITLSSLLMHPVIILHRISIYHLWKCCPASRINSLGSSKLALNTQVRFCLISFSSHSQYTSPLHVIARCQPDTTDIEKWERDPSYQMLFRYQNLSTQKFEKKVCAYALP